MIKKGAPEKILGKALSENGWNKDTQDDDLAKKEGNTDFNILGREG